MFDLSALASATCFRRLHTEVAAALVGAPQRACCSYYYKSLTLGSGRPVAGSGAVAEVAGACADTGFGFDEP